MSSSSYLFISVGTTKFDTLMTSVDSQTFASAISSSSLTGIVIQKGSSTCTLTTLSSACESLSLPLEIYDYKPSIKADMEGAGAVLAHAGAGTITEVLRMGLPLVVCVNTSLMDNHQEELAHAMEDAGYLIVAPEDNVDAIADAVNRVVSLPLVPFPKPAAHPFAHLLDQELGL